MLTKFKNDCVLTGFKVFLPRFQIKQEDALDWVYEAHLKVQENQVGWSSLDDDRVLRKKRNFQHYFVKPTQVQTRWIDVPDFTSKDEKNYEIYQSSSNQGRNIREKAEFFSKRALKSFQYFYPSSQDPPEHLIHVTCTGYTSPSAAQRIVAQHRWMDRPRVSHAYHMGCYAALSSIRLAQGLLESCDLRGSSLPRIDLVHTELCSLHMNPHSHDPEQIVIQSLFGDGYIKYSAVSKQDSNRGFLILEHAELIVPETAEEMTWIPEPWGMGMTLSGNVPRSISGQLARFIEYILDRAGIPLHQALQEAYFAVHPGGPKIIDEVQRILELQNWQLQASRHILLQRGNMSSATLPHIWNELLEQQIRPGTKVVSLAFGPGLSILGSVFEVV